MGKKVSKSRRPVVGISIKTLEEVRFDTIKEAEDCLNCVGIMGCVSGRRKTCGGYLWRFEDEDFSPKAKDITDKRIKVYEMTNGEETYILPLEMLSNKTGVLKSGIINASKGGEGYQLKHAEGFKVREVSKEEAEEVLSTISYIDYLKSRMDKVEIDPKRNQSIGEHIVETILEGNSIPFVAENRIPDTRMCMDFFLPDYNICIEHQGRHHYPENETTFTTSYEYIKETDDRKAKYCKDNGIKMVYIKYDKTIEEIFNILSEVLPLKVFPEVYTLNGGLEINITEFDELYQNNQASVIADKYNVEEHTIDNIIAKTGVRKRFK